MGNPRRNKSKRRNKYIGRRELRRTKDAMTKDEIPRVEIDGRYRRYG